MQARAVITKHEEVRRQTGYTVTGLARAFGMSHTYVSRIEGQEIPASDRYRRLVARLFGVRQALLFSEDGRAR